MTNAQVFAEVVNLLLLGVALGFVVAAAVSAIRGKLHKENNMLLWAILAYLLATH